MRLTKTRILKIEKFAQKEIIKNKDPFHDWKHVLTTAKLASYIAKKEKANTLVCYIAGLLHDIAPKTYGKTHGLQSAEIAKKFLEKMKLDKSFINQIYLAIAFHDTATQHKAETLEAKIIFEADKLQCFGPIGFIREYGDLLLQGIKAEDTLDKTMKYLKTYNPPFTTKTGKKLKKELQDFNKSFIKTFNKWDKITL